MLRARAKPLGKLFTDLQQSGRPAKLQRLFIRIDTDKLHTVYLFIYILTVGVVTKPFRFEAKARMTNVCTSAKSRLIIAGILIRSVMPCTAC